ncbi:unnamed protein product [Penicillium roqueforti FM164]|uniref:Azaphilone pigments biosynthesis cluster protein L N-terminal domain-containing protein n=1 Tax=Penicillium roqueforti (strain FM164) TaxID=1365484 RepID=W6QPN5_PENRF|nr:unnamed protein product [Penicillium roqueforti FM164]
MVDPLSVTTSILLLAGFALQSFLSPRNVIDDFQTSKKDVRKLKKGLQAVCQVLGWVHRVAAEYQHELKVLNFQLRVC